MNDRHQALRDEREVYKHVCDSFPLQLSHCSRLIDEAEAETKRKEKEIYDIRSAIEEGRKQVLNLVRDSMEGLSKLHSNDDFSQSPTHASDNCNSDLVSRLNHILSDHHVGMLGGVHECIELLIAHARDMFTKSSELLTNLNNLQREHESLRNATSTDLQQNEKALDAAFQTQNIEKDAVRNVLLASKMHWAMFVRRTPT